MRTIFITEAQKSAIGDSLLLELSNRAVQREIEGAIREYCANSCCGYPIKRYLDTPLSECPPYIKQICDPSGEGQMWRSVANNQTGANKFIDFLRLNFTSQFCIGRNSGPAFFAPGLAKISMGELGFYSFDPNIMQGGKITTLGNLAMIMANAPELIEDLHLDEYFNGMSFSELMDTVAPKIKEFKKKQNEELDSMTIEANNGHSYTITKIDDEQANYAQRTPNYESRRFLQSLSNYTDWCICGTMGDMEYAQYVSNGSKFYICLRDDYKNVPREQGDKCPLDEYGLSMIAVKVAPDGLPDNVTTRWNHDNGGENHHDLWLATQLQKILGVRFKDIFKPRSREELSQMNVGGAGELEEGKTPSIYDQVKGVNDGFMRAAAGVMEEESIGTAKWYRGYDKDLGAEKTHLIWLTDDPSYAKKYGDTVDELEIDESNIVSISDLDDDLDYYAGPDAEDCERYTEEGKSGYYFTADSGEEDYQCICLWDKSAIIGRRTLIDNEYDDIEEGAEPESDKYMIGGEGGNNEYFHAINESKEYDFKKYFKPIADFMRSEGLNVYPYPKVKLNWDEQDGLFIKTGYYEPESKTIVIFCADRHPKDILRTYAHEMIHHSQNLDGKDLNFSSVDDVKDNERLEKIEGEAYLKGNLYFRKWTEYEQAQKKSLNENIDRESVTVQAPDDKYQETLDFGINVNIDEKDWLELIFDGEKTIATCGGRSYKQWKEHVGEMVGLVKTTRHPSKDDPSGMLVGYARLAAVKQYTDYNFVDDYPNHLVSPEYEDAEDRCGLVLNDVHELSGDGIKMSHETKTVRPLNYPNEQLDEDTNPEDIDLSSFNIKHNLNPKFWKDERLDSRIRMKLLDIADDFIEFLGVDWVKPDDVIMTGSLANFNWNKKYSDIDLHILMDYSKVDKRTDFVKQYFYSQKQLWNDEHKDLKIMGFPVEVYVQDTKEKHSSTGVYSIDKDKWITEPEREKLSKAKVNKSYIKKKVAEYIDKIEDLLTIYKEANGDEYKIRKVSEDSEKLFDRIKEERSNGLEASDSEISNGNVIFKCLRRMGYIEKLAKLRGKTYDKMNSIS